jgi:hypothetical protein
MQKLNIITVIVAFLLLAECSLASPLFRQLFGNYNQDYYRPSTGYQRPSYPSYQPTYNYPSPSYPTKQRPQKEGRSYKEICKAINPSPYAFPGKLPFPSVPVC